MNLLRRSFKASLFLGSIHLASTSYFLDFDTDDIYCFYSGYYRSNRVLFALGKVVLNYKIFGYTTQTHDYAGKTMYQVCKKNKGAYIKLGQMVPQFEHIVPEEYIKHLSPLFQDAPTTPMTEVKKMIEKDLKQPFDSLFSTFSPEPIGTASIGQVHAATLLNGTKVAVKIQHPYIELLTPIDIKFTEFAARIAEKIFRGIKFKWWAREARVNLTQEIDFFNEIEAIDRFKENFKGVSYVVFPTVYKELSGKRVLIMSFEEGRSILDKDYLEKEGIDLFELADKFSRMNNKQLFEDGFIHGDPHPGNIFVRNETVNGRKELKIVSLDHGLCKELSPTFKEGYSRLWRGILNQDMKEIERGAALLNVKNGKLLATVVTGRQFHDIMDDKRKYQTSNRLGIRPKQGNKEKVKKFINDNFYDMLDLFEELDKDAMLVLKSNNYTRSLDARMGRPLNNFNRMLGYVYAELMKRSDGMIEWTRLFVEYNSFRFYLFALRVYFYMYSFVWKIEVEEENKLDVSYQAI